MSIIQTIRDKAAWIIIILIGVSLLGFLVQDAFVGKTGRGLFGGQTNTVGKINGKKVDNSEYEKITKAVEDRYAQMGYSVNDATRQSVDEQAWAQIISDYTITDETEALGLTVSNKERDEMLTGPNADPNFKRNFTDDKGVFDVDRARQFLAQINKEKSDRADQFFNVYMPALVTTRLQEKFGALFANTVYYPKWMLEKLAADNSAMASVSFVHVPYTTIADSTVKVSDDDIAAFENKHAALFKQEENRSVSYVVFDGSASAADSADIKNSLELLKKGFAETPAADLTSFLASNGAQTELTFAPKNMIQVPNKDSLIALPIGGVFGPYLDGGNYVIARKVEERSQPDSSRVRHILIATVNPQTQQPIVDDSTAKKKIDSIAALIDHGQRFDSLAAKLSDDKGTAIKGGEFGWLGFGSSVVPEFKEFSLGGKKGERKVVKSMYGYHLIEIEDQKNFQPAYKIAYIYKPIAPSTTTDQHVSGLANQFASDSRNTKSFDENAAKRNLTKLIAQDIKPNDRNVGALGANRAFVKWVYEADRGDVSSAFAFGDKYIVAVVTGIEKAGLASPAKARPQVEYILRNQKKGEIIAKKIGTVTTLEAVATAMTQTVQKFDSLAFANPSFPNGGMEGKVGGYAFCPAAKGKVSAPIIGNGGVYCLRTENVYAKQSLGGIDQERNMLLQNEKMAVQRGALESVLKNAADIVDERSRIY